MGEAEVTISILTCCLCWDFEHVSVCVLSSGPTAALLYCTGLGFMAVTS